VFTSALIAASTLASGSFELYSAEPSMTVLAAPKWAAGVVFGLVGENNLNEIETCAHDGVSMAPEIEAALHELRTGDFESAVANLMVLVNEIPTLLSDCKGMNDDITAIKEWASIFNSRALLVATLAKNWVLHKRGIKSDIADAEASWAEGAYFSAGLTSADILVKAVGPIQPNYAAVANFSAKAIPDFIAGFIYGMTGDNDLVEIEACYEGSKEVEMFFTMALNDLKKGGTDNDIQAALEFGLALAILPQSLTTCKGMDDDIAAIEEWAQIFTDVPKLTATLSKNYLLHKKRIESDISKVEADADAGQWFQCGVDAADLATTAIGPIK